MVNTQENIQYDLSQTNKRKYTTMKEDKKMKWKAIVTIPLLSSLFLSACGTNDNSVNDTAMRDQANK